MPHSVLVQRTVPAESHRGSRASPRPLCERTYRERSAFIYRDAGWRNRRARQRLLIHIASNDPIAATRSARSTISDESLGENNRSTFVTNISWRKFTEKQVRSTVHQKCDSNIGVLPIDKSRGKRGAELIPGQTRTSTSCSRRSIPRQPRIQCQPIRASHPSDDFHRCGRF